MAARIFWAGVVLMAAQLGFHHAQAEDVKGDAKAAQPRISDLSLEVTALQTLHQFQFTLIQMQKIRRCARETTDKGENRQEGQASKEFRDKLEELHKALVRANDDELIEELSDELEDLRLDENPSLEDDIKLTKEARRCAPELLKVLKANQYAAYTALLIDLIDPLDLLHESLAKVRDLQGSEWRAKRKQIAAEIGRLVGGVDAVKEAKVSKAVAALLTRARKMKKQDFDEQRDKLEEAARHIIGAIGPADIIRNEVEYTIAELLSNARLSAALAARLQL